MIRRPVNSAPHSETAGPETWELMAAIANQIGVRRIARATGRHERTIYYWTHDPLTAEGAEGHTNLFDWNEQLFTEMAGVPRARGELLRSEDWFRRLFNRLLRREDPEPITDGELLRRCAVAAREHGQALAELLDGDDDDAAALREALEARDALDQVIRGIESRGRLG